MMEVRRSRIAGQGLFATEPIPAGAVIANLQGLVVTTAELRQLLTGDRPVDSITLDDDRHLLLPQDPRPMMAYGNHSCDPSMWWADATTVVARRNIDTGEELTSDYATCTGVEDFEMECHCGSPLCRKVITGRDWRLPELQKRYDGHWIPYLREKIRNG